MAVENDFLPFSASSGANVMSQATYAGLSYLQTGVIAGLADPTLYNKSIRQATLWAYFISQYVVNETGQPAIDNGDLVTPLTNLTAAIQAGARSAFHPPQVTVLTTVGTGTFTTPTIGGVLPISLEIEMVGGGSGGGGSGTGSPAGGTAGGSTLFGSSILTAQGGPATPTNTSTSFPIPAAATGGDINISGGLGAPPSVLNLSAANNAGQSAYGASSPFGSGGTPGTINLGAATMSSREGFGFGSGGGGGGNGSTGATYNSGWGGNSGSSLKAIISAPAASYPYTVGSAGVGGPGGPSGAPGGAGTPGFIRIIARWQ